VGGFELGETLGAGAVVVVREPPAVPGVAIGGAGAGAVGCGVTDKVCDTPAGVPDVVVGV
jgi:hypothetical protein